MPSIARWTLRIPWSTATRRMAPCWVRAEGSTVPTAPWHSGRASSKAIKLRPPSTISSAREISPSLEDVWNRGDRVPATYSSGALTGARKSVANAERRVPDRLAVSLGDSRRSFKLHGTGRRGSRGPSQSRRRASQELAEEVRGPMPLLLTGPPHGHQPCGRVRRRRRPRLRRPQPRQCQAVWPGYCRKHTFDRTIPGLESTDGYGRGRVENYNSQGGHR